MNRLSKLFVVGLFLAQGLIVASDVERIKHNLNLLEKANRPLTGNISSLGLTRADIDAMTSPDFVKLEEFVRYHNLVRHPLDKGGRWEKSDFDLINKYSGWDQAYAQLSEKFGNNPQDWALRVPLVSPLSPIARNPEFIQYAKVALILDGKM